MQLDPETLTARRKSLGISQEEMAEELGLTRTTIVNWEKTNILAKWGRAIEAYGYKIVGSIDPICTVGELMDKIQELVGQDCEIELVIKPKRSEKTWCISHSKAI